MVKLICVECPMGCDIQVEVQDGKVISVTGNTCPRGKLYAQNEITCPKRVLTTTVKSVDGRLLPVKTSLPVKKADTFVLMQKVNEIIVQSPIRIGDVVVKDFADGADLIATGNLE